MQVVFEPAPRAALAVPAGHAVALVEERGQKCPAGHVVQIVAPAAENVPAGQGVGFTEDRGQKLPAGHCTGEPVAQKKEAGQGAHMLMT